MDRHGDPLFMTSFARGLLVIRAFSGPGRRRTVSEISRGTGLSRAAARRCLYTLCQLGYVRCECRAYWLLPKVLGISHGALPATGIGAQEVHSGAR
ncbi:MAG: helix-turn-helix domain-containing protein [Proteobacteria bacterium]|nr:helix-turn-helix domain-containing protein [Pseudomonadota bacterium]